MESTFSTKLPPVPDDDDKNLNSKAPDEVFYNPIVQSSLRFWCPVNKIEEFATVVFNVGFKNELRLRRKIRLVSMIPKFKIFFINECNIVNDSMKWWMRLTKTKIFLGIKITAHTEWLRNIKKKMGTYIMCVRKNLTRIFLFS